MVVARNVAGAPRPVEVAEKAFLGSEFLTWLLYKGDESSGSFGGQSGGELGIYVDDLLVLSSTEPKGQVDTFRGGAPASSLEAGVALLAGKKVVRLRLMIARGAKEWFITLDHNLDVRALKVPRPEAEDQAEREAEVLASIDEVMGIVDDLFTRFLHVRLGDQWEGREVGRLQAWVRTRGQEVCHV